MGLRAGQRLFGDAGEQPSNLLPGLHRSRARDSARYAVFPRPCGGLWKWCNGDRGRFQVIFLVVAVIPQVR